jgi:hypothetical protein
LFWRTVITSAPELNLPLLARNNNCSFWLQKRSASSGFKQQLLILVPDKICLFWLPTTAPSGSRQDLPLLASNNNCSFWFQTRSASSGYQQLLLLAPDKICLFWLLTRAALFGSRQDLPPLAPDKTFLFQLK